MNSRRPQPWQATPRSLFKKGLRLLVLQAGLLFCQTLPAAVGFTVSPSAVSNTYNGSIILQVTGLSGGETVVIQKFLGANTNGVIDGGDLLVQQFQLTDGQASVIGGVTNINVPGDIDSTAAQITASLNSGLMGFEQQILGKYLFKLSSPAGSFSPITNPFNVTNFPFAQSFTGNVVSSGTNVPNAAVLLFTFSGDGLNPQAGTVADNSGAYAIKAAPGVYLLAAFKSNFVANVGASPLLTLGSGATINTNLTLTSATRSISGKVVDASNPNLGLPGYLVPVQTSSGLLTISFTDTNGNFTERVTSDLWKVGGNSRGLASYGYVSLQNKPRVDASTGSVSGVTFSLPKATALFYGSVKDSSNNPLAGVDLFAEDRNTFQYESEGLTDQNGDYVAGVLAGNWAIQVDNNQSSSLANYIFSQSSSQQNGTNLSAGQAVLQNFTALLATNHITGYLKDNHGNPIASVQIYAYANINGKDYQSQADTDGNGNYSLKVANGNWSVSVCCGCNDCDNCLSSAYCCVNDQTVNIANGDGVANFTAALAGEVAITTVSPLPDATVGNFYQIQFDASSCQSPFNWSATNPPAGLTLFSDGTLSGVPNTAGSNYFYVQVSDAGSHTTNQAFSLTIKGSLATPPTLGQ